jgi:elongation factor G
VEDILKVHKADTIRNIAVVGHESTGKTLLTEAMLKVSGNINRMGSIEGNNTVSDYSLFEQERQKSLFCTHAQFEWADCKLNCLDTPGFSDFFGETHTALHVADIAMVVVSPVNGPEVITEKVMEEVEQRSMPCLFVLNGLDREHTQFDAELEIMKTSYSGVAPIQYPIDPGESFCKVVDILKGKILVYDEEGTCTEEELGGEADRVEEMIGALTETVAESDDDLMEAYLETMELTEEQFSKGLAQGIAKGTIRPVMVTSAKKIVAVDRLMNVVCDLFPSPEIVDSIVDSEGNNLHADCSQPARALVYKSVLEQHVGELVFFRMVHGSLKTGEELQNIDRGGTEKFGSLFSIIGKTRTDLTEVRAGDIGCTVKMRNTRSGDSLCTKGSDLKIQPVVFPEPVMRTAIEPANADDDEKMSTGLHSIQHEDPSFSIHQDGELHQTILAGMGDQQFHLLLEKLQHRVGVKVNMLKPRVPYRETITGNSQVKYRHRKQTGGAGQFAEVWIRIKAGERGSGFVFKSEVVGGSVTEPFQQATRKGIEMVMDEGVIAGCHVEDVEVCIYDGKMHPVDSKEIAFQTAGREAFKQGFADCKPILLEPIWEVEVKVPEDFMGDVMGDLSSRRGKIQGMEASGKYQLIKAQVPLAELYQYSTTLRSMTSGRASHKRRFDHYAKCPPDVQTKVIEDYAAEKAKD